MYTLSQFKAPAKRSQHANATYRNIVGRKMLRAFGHRVAMCCNMLGVVGSLLKMVKFEPTTPNTSQHVATGWPNARNMLHPTMLRYVALACCDRLAGALKCRLTSVPCELQKSTSSCFKYSQHTVLWYWVQSSPSELLQYIGLWPIVMIQGRNARFSGDEASYEVTSSKSDIGQNFAKIEYIYNVHSCPVKRKVIHDYRLLLFIIYRTLSAFWLVKTHVL